MKAIILARVSTEEQMTEGQSIPAQLARAQEYAKRKGLDVIREYQFDESSIKDTRTKFEKVVDDIKKSKDKIALIVETVDRLQRSFKESVMLDELRKQDKLELHFIRENLIIHKESNSSEIQRWDLAVFVAKSFVLQISDNVKRTFDQKIKKGEVTGRATLGYLNSEDEKGNKEIIPDPSRAQFIVRIFELYSTGNYSMDRIAKITNEEGLKSILQNNLKVRQIESILKNPFYYGQRIHKGQLYPHKYQPIITYDLFLRCQKVREGYPKKPSKYSTKPYIFRGLMTCSKCGCTITPEIHKGKYVYYHCTNYKKTCEKIWVNETELLKPVRELLKGLKLTQERIDEVVESLKTTEQAKNEFQKTQLKILRQEYDIIDKRISVMYTDRLDGRITTDMYDQKLKEFKEEQYNILFKMKQFDNASNTYYITANTVLSLAQKAEEIFESSEPEEKRQLLNFLFQNLQLDGKNLIYKLKTPFEGVLLANTSHSMGQLCDMFRTIDWGQIEQELTLLPKALLFTAKY
jgi:DNA invertase Pin-like site-specific DNA recombinase